MNAQFFDTTRAYVRRDSVRDVLVAKAITNGCNPYCKSTDADARRVTDDMRAKVRNVIVPNVNAVAPVAKRAAVREVVDVRTKEMSKAHREVVHIENFQLVKPV